MITAEHLEGSTWKVTVEDTVTTHHRVNVSEEDVERFSGGASVEDLLKESFSFLLEREPNTSILGAFDLPVIATYFPEYETEIQRRLQTG
jgi:hypothetical protein